MITIEEAIEELKDASYSEARYGDKDNHRDKVMKRVEAFGMAIKVLEQQPCEDCISREKVNKIINKWLSSPYFEYKNYIYEMTKAIHELPSIQPERFKGKWIHWTDDYKDYVTCSCCGYGEEGEVLLSDKTPFCPICGADVRGDTE